MIGSNDEPMSSNKPYLVRAFYQWISDNELTPYIMVDVSVYGVEVPMGYVNDGQIVLNIATSAVGNIALGDYAIEFSARFGGKLEQLIVPYGAIGAIYAKENGAGTSLPIEHNKQDEDTVGIPSKPTKLQSVATKNPDDNIEKPSSITKKTKAKKPSLKVIK